jgi:hypothetical protein
VVRERDRDEALALGASAAVAAEEGDLGGAVRKVAPGGADAVLDTASLGATALSPVRDGGPYITVTQVPLPERDISVARSFGRMDREGLTTLVAMASTGRLHTPWPPSSASRRHAGPTTTPARGAVGAGWSSALPGSRFGESRYAWYP